MTRTPPYRTMTSALGLAAVLGSMGIVGPSGTANATTWIGSASIEIPRPAIVAVQYSSTVAGLQRGLNELGYDAGPVDGLMGSRTRIAIEAYQRDERLLVTGRASADLLAHVDATLAERRSSPSAAESEATPDAPTQLTIDIQAGLRRLGYDVPVVSGVMDATTQEAIRAYQRDQNLLVTGSASEPLLAHIEDRIEVSSGDLPTRAEMVQQIQIELNERGYYTGLADGVLGSGTRSAIRTYQADAGLPVTGEASMDLLEQLRGDEGTAVEDGGVPDGIDAEPETVLAIADDFDGGSLAGRWRTLQGDFVVTGGTLRSSIPVPTAPQSTEDLLEGLASDLVRGVLGQALGADLSQPRPVAALSAGASLQNAFSVTLDVEQAGGSGSTFAVGPTQQRDANIGYRLLIRPGQDLRLMVFSGNSTRIVASTGQTLSAGGNGTVEWTRDSDGRMRVTLDGSTVIDTTDGAFGGAFDGIVMVNYGGDWGIEAIRVTTPGS